MKKHLQELHARQYPAHMYVDVPALTKSISAVIFLVCIFSLALSFLTGFRIIHPYVSVTVGFAAAAFYLMGEMLRRLHGRK